MKTSPNCYDAEASSLMTSTVTETTVKDNGGLGTDSGATSASKVRPFFRDLALTAATEFTALVAALVMVSLFGRFLGVIALGEYLMLRRLVSWLQGAVQLGLGTALTRYVAHTSDSKDGKRETYFLITMGISLLVATMLGTILVFLKPAFARLFFGKEEMKVLILPLSFMLLGCAMHSAVYGYYRGRLFMRLANAAQFCNLALIPLISILLFSHTGSVAVIVGSIGTSMCLCSGFFAIPIILMRVRRARVNLRQRSSEMLRYALPRLIGDIAFGGLMALPPIVASHYVAMNRLVYLLLGASILTALTAGVAPLGIILLSKVSIMLRQGKVDDLRERLDFLIAALLELSVFCSLQLLVFTDVVIHAWVGRSLLENTLVIRLLLIAVPFLVLYVGLRSVVDAASLTAYNSRNLLIVLSSMLVAIFLIIRLVPESFVLESIAFVWACALAVLGWLTSRTLRQLLGLSVNYRQMFGPFLIACVLAGASLFIHWMNRFATGVLAVVVIEVCAAALFLACLRRLGPWLPYVWNAVFQRPGVSELSLTQS
jgi:O-antigen/teichoic acid export membrane protein